MNKQMRSLVMFFVDRPLLFCFTLGAVFNTYWWLKFQKQLNIKWYTAPVLAAMHFLFAMVAMRIWGLLEVGGNVEDAASMRLFGALFLLPLLYYLGAKITKRDLKLVMDICFLCTVVGLVPGRVNCLINGCCEGICIVPGGEMRWPLREIEIAWALVMVLIFLKRILERKTKGYAFPICFISYGTLRFLLEWLREEYTGRLGIFHLAHIWSLLSIAIGVILCLQVNQYNKARVKTRNKNKEDKK